MPLHWAITILGVVVGGAVGYAVFVMTMTLGDFWVDRAED